EDLALELANVFIVVNAFNQTFKIAREALEALREHYPEYLLKTVVRQCTKFAQASSEGKPVFAFDPNVSRAKPKVGFTRGLAGVLEADDPSAIALTPPPPRELEALEPHAAH